MEIPITASLSDWEKKLLLNFQQSFPKDVATSNTQTTNDLGRIFNSWCWVRKLRRDIGEVFKNVPRSLGSNSPAIWELICRWISHCDDGYMCHSRLSQLLQDNKDLERQFVNTKLAPSIDENLSIIPCNDDRPFWAIVVDAMYCLPSPWRGLAPDESVSDRFSYYILLSDVSTDKAKMLVEGLTSPLVIGGTTSGSPPPEAESSAPAPCHHDKEPQLATQSSSDTKMLLERPKNKLVIDDKASEPPAREAESSALASYHQPQLATHSRSDTKMLLERLKNKLVIDDEAPNTKTAFERLEKKLSMPSAPAPCHHDKEPRFETESVAGEARSSSDTKYNVSTSHYREFEIWSLTRMAGMVRRQQLRRAKLAENTEPAFGFIVSITFDNIYAELTSRIASFLSG